jgi:AcrR family transcriptional regulator
LHAVDDLLLEVGYAEMTMKGIAERAGVGRQTVYRWWSTKAEILFEASVYDAVQELDVDVDGSPVDVLAAYLQALIDFLVRSPAGAAYRALVGEAQHDAAVATLLSSRDVLGDSARPIVQKAVGEGSPVSLDDLTAQLIGPTFFWIVAGRDPAQLNPRRLVEAFMWQLEGQPTPGSP